MKRGFILLVLGVSVAAVALALSEGKRSGGGAFEPTKPNQVAPPGPAPEGMVWIPGGEFSMGSDEASESLCGLPGVTRTRGPIHRVYVDGFWMDARR